MKKFLSLHGLGMVLYAVAFSGLSTQGIWWKVLIIGLVFIFQVILENFDRYSYLRWNHERDGFSKPEQEGDLTRKIWFLAVKALIGIFVIGIALGYGKQLTSITGLAMWLVPIILFFLYYGKKIYSLERNNISLKIELAKKIVTISLLSSAVFTSFLNFGTGYVWLSSFLALMLLSGLMINDLVGEVEFEKGGIKKVVIIVLSVLPFAVSIVSTVYQFRTNICHTLDSFFPWVVNVSGPACDAIADFLTYRVGTISIWVIILGILALWVLIKIFRDIYTREINDKEMKAKQAQAEKEEAEAQIVLENNLKMIIYSLANDKPISKEYLVYLMKHQNHLEGFPLKKLICLNLEQMFFTISIVRQKIVWDHDLEDVLRMYNSWFKKAETSDDILLLLTKSVIVLYNSVKEHKGYQSFSAFEKMIKDTTPNILAMAGIA